MGAVRVNPPITILLLIGLAFTGLALNNQIGECRFDPEGKLRWNAIPEWFYKVDPNASAIPCDPWTGIASRKPIGIIEIRETTASIRIEPSGRIAIILHPWRDSLDYFDKSQRPKYQAPDALRSDRRVVLSGQSTAETYQRVRALISPMRDFADYVREGRSVPDFIAEPWLPADDRTFLRHEFYDLDDPRTKLGKCRRTVCDGGTGWQIAFWEEGTGRFQSQSMYFEIGCTDLAARAGARRVSKATALIANAIHAEGTLERHREANRHYRP